MRRAAAAPAALALLLAACADTRTDPLLPPDPESRSVAAERARASAPLVLPSEPEATPPPAVETTTDAPPATATARASDPAAPHIYMALQTNAGGPVSVVLTIDASRDNTPSDDPAIRITPADGQCNPQQLARHSFPPEGARRPTYGPEEAAAGVTARDLPDFMATAVTTEMMNAGLIDDRDESQPQNVCTRKLLQRMIIDLSAANAS